MNRRSFLTASAAAALAPVLLPGQAAAQAAIDYDALAALRAMGLNEESSQVMKTASYLTDVLGPRLTGSPAIQKSADWIVSKMKEWGFANAGLEAWPTDPTGNNNSFPHGWVNTKFYLQTTAPFTFPVAGMAIAWTPGTKGLVGGECVLVTETAEADLKAKYDGKLRGKWILNGAPLVLGAQWDAVAKRLTREQLDTMETPDRPPEQGAPPSPPPPPRFRPPGPNDFNRFAWFAEQGALGVLATNKGHGVFNISGAPRNEAPEKQIPRIAIEAEHYGRIARALQFGETVTLEADIRNEWSDNPPMFNVVGELRGTQWPEETVIIGGHFDSWHAATGATDNGGACCIALEALRLLKATKAPLKRTIRVCLWTGEEQGLFGSRLYVTKHFGGIPGARRDAKGTPIVEPVTREHSRFQAYFNLDNGAGSIRGIYTQGNSAIVPIFREWIEPLRDLGMTHVTTASTGGTDHLSFDRAGLPGFQFIQDPLNYEPTTHHTNLDVFEELQPEDMRRNAVLMASFAMMAANHPGKLPRKLRPPANQPPPPSTSQRIVQSGAP